MVPPACCTLQVLYFTANHKPTILENSTAVTVGRVTLPRQGRGRNRESNSGVFAGTRPALALLEQLAAAVANREPVLLVGETGVGKTAAVQHLARLTGELEVACLLREVHQEKCRCSALYGCFKGTLTGYLYSSRFLIVHDI